MTTHRMKRFAWPGSLALVFVAGAAFGSYLDDQKAAQKLTQIGAQFGWWVHMVPPCGPANPCKPRVALDVNTQVRADLDQQVTLSHDEGSGILPCVRVLHHFAPDGSMFEDIDLLDGDDSVLITVPEGFELVATDLGYEMAPIAP
jgi:hypothetical protein